MVTSFRAVRAGCGLALALGMLILILQEWGQAQQNVFHTYRSYPYAFSNTSSTLYAPNPQLQSALTQMQTFLQTALQQNQAQQNAITNNNNAGGGGGGLGGGGFGGFGAFGNATLLAQLQQQQTALQAALTQTTTAMAGLKQNGR